VSSKKRGKKKGVYLSLLEAIKGGQRHSLKFEKKDAWKVGQKRLGLLGRLRVRRRQKEKKKRQKSPLCLVAANNPGVIRGKGKTHANPCRPATEERFRRGFSTKKKNRHFLREEKRKKERQEEGAVLAEDKDENCGARMPSRECRPVLKPKGGRIKLLSRKAVEEKTKPRGI